MLANLNSLQATFCWVFAGPPPPPQSFKTCLKNDDETIGPTPQNLFVYTLNFIEMQDTNFAGHLAEFAGQQDI